MQPPTLHTARLRLDAVRPDDTPFVAEYCADLELQRYVPVPVPYTREHADDYCVNYARAAAEGEGARWAIRWGEVESGITVADTGASPIVPGLLGVVAGNIGSASVARSCGFRFEGLSRAALPHRDQRVDAWCATLLASDSRDPQPGWPAPLEGPR